MFRLRPITIDDIDQADDLFERSIRANPDGFRARPSESNRDFMLRLMGYRFERTGDFLVGDIEGKIVCVGGLDPHGMKMTNPDGRFPELARVHVDANYQRRGYGKAIVNTVINMAAGMGYEEMQLHVTQSQKVALNLYETMGWKKFHDEVFSGSDGKEYPTSCYRLSLIKAQKRGFSINQNKSLSH